MKSRVLKTKDQVQKEVEKIADREAKKRVDEIYATAETNTAYQVMATVFCVLNKEFGFGKKRLTRLKNYTEDEFVRMAKGCLGRDYSSADCCKYLKGKYNIDFSETQYTGGI